MVLQKQIHSIFRISLRQFDLRHFQQIADRFERGPGRRQQHRIDDHAVAAGRSLYLRQLQVHRHRGCCECLSHRVEGALEPSEVRECRQIGADEMSGDKEPARHPLDGLLLPCCEQGQRQAAFEVDPLAVLVGIDDQRCQLAGVGIQNRELPAQDPVASRAFVHPFGIDAAHRERIGVDRILVRFAAPPCHGFSIRTTWGQLNPPVRSLRVTTRMSVPSSSPGSDLSPSTSARVSPLIRSRSSTRARPCVV